MKPTRADERLLPDLDPAAPLGPGAQRGAPMVLRVSSWLLVGALAVVLVSTPLDLWSQVLFASTLFVACWMLSLSRQARLVTITLAVVSSLVSIRYLSWRIQSTLDVEGGLDLALGLTLLSAELYAVLVLVLGYVQTVWPLRRRPVALPDDPSTWPTVDVMIPTYNEPLSVVRATILAARALDYPKDKLRVWVLDDGRREEFKRFCDEASVGYLIRPDNKHAKAGNINRALDKTQGDLIAIFDCDHIPTASFLKTTVGWFLRDDKLALVQTPHHFYSPDPFERNLQTFRRVPNEGELFYGTIQKGNDLWDAAFFCGSCAVIRRAPLEEVGGIAPETVTEDAHTMLKLHRRGYRSAYLDIPQAAGLATESLSSHVGQRIRWARGLAQIFRIDTPLFGRGLSFEQRLCYTSAMLHFFYGIPRIIFLVAPLFHLFLNAHIFNASAAMILAYAIPHMAHAYLTNSRIQGRHRHSFWAEVYEATLAAYIAYPTTLALISPRLGKFNVTAKGGVVEHGYFDARIATPHLVLFGLNLAGMTYGIWRLSQGDPESDAVALNLAWTIYNSLFLCAALGVAWEKQQRRATVRVAANLPAMLRLPDQKAYACRTVDLSVSGARVALAVSLQLKKGDVVELAMQLDRDVVPAEATVVWQRGAEVGLAFAPLPIEAESSLVRAIFSRPDAWLDWAQGRAPDRPLRSLARVMAFGFAGLFRVPAILFARGRPGAAALILGACLGLAADEVRAQAPGEPDTGGPSEAGGSPDAGGGALDAGGDVEPAGPEPGSVPEFPPTSRLPREGDTLRGTLPPGADHPDTPHERAPERARGRAGEGAIDEDVSGPVPEGWSARSLEGLGFSGGVRRYNRWPNVRLPFFARGDEVFTGTRVELVFDPAAQVPPGVRALAVTINDEAIGEVPLEPLPADPVVLEVAPQLLAERNALGLALVLAADATCPALVEVGTWRFLRGGRILTRVAPLPLPNALEMLPLPFFDPFADAVTPIPFVIAGEPTPRHVEIGAVVAGYFAARAGSRFTFPTRFGALPSEHAVLVTTAADPVLVPDLGPITGPVIALRDNPQGRARHSKVLVLAGRDLDEVAVAARRLAFDYEATKGRREGTVAVTGAPRLPTRQPNDAPRWARLDAPITLGALAEAPKRLLRGALGGTVSFEFRMPPDLFVWPRGFVELRLAWRELIPAGIDAPELAVELNGFYLKGLPTGGERGRDVIREAVMRVPVGELRGYNRLLVHVVPGGTYCPDPDSDLFEIEVQPESSLAVAGYPSFKLMPDVSSFVDDGFPFTRLADLSQTLLVLPAEPLAEEIAAGLSFAGHTAAVTGHPASGLQVSFGGKDLGATGRDVLVVGVASRLPLLGALESRLPLAGLTRGTPGPRAIEWPERAFAFLRGEPIEDELARLTADLRPGEPRSYVLGLESPSDPGRSVVIVTADAASALPSHDALRGYATAIQPHADLLVRSADKRQSYRVSAGYTVGSLSWWVAVRWWFARHWFVLLPATLVVGMLFGWVMRRRLARLEWQRLSIKDTRA